MECTVRAQGYPYSCTEREMLMHMCTMQGSYKPASVFARDPFPFMVVAVNVPYDHHLQPARKRGDAFVCFARPEIAAHFIEQMCPTREFKGRAAKFGRARSAMRMRSGRGGAGTTRIGAHVWDVDE